MSKVRIGRRVVVKGAGFTDVVHVFVDGVPFSTSCTVKELAKVVQKGKLVTGPSVLEHVANGRDHEVVFVNSDPSITQVSFKRP